MTPQRTDPSRVSSSTNLSTHLSSILQTKEDLFYHSNDYILQIQNSLYDNLLLTSKNDFQLVEKKLCFQCFQRAFQNIHLNVDDAQKNPFVWTSTKTLKHTLSMTSQDSLLSDSLLDSWKDKELSSPSLPLSGLLRRSSLTTPLSVYAMTPKVQVPTHPRVSSSYPPSLIEATTPTLRCQSEHTSRYTSPETNGKAKPVSASPLTKNSSTNPPISEEAVLIDASCTSEASSLLPNPSSLSSPFPVFTSRKKRFTFSPSKSNHPPLAFTKERSAPSESSYLNIRSEYEYQLICLLEECCLQYYRLYIHCSSDFSALFTENDKTITITTESNPSLIQDLYNSIHLYKSRILLSSSPDEKQYQDDIYYFKNLYSID